MATGLAWLRPSAPRSPRWRRSSAWKPLGLGRRRPCGPILTADAMSALRTGDATTHNRLVAAACGELAGVDAIMLAQFSTSRALRDARTIVSMPVLSSPDAAVRKLKRLVSP